MVWKSKSHVMYISVSKAGISLYRAQKKRPSKGALIILEGSPI